jgi:hypothetical protein
VAAGAIALAALATAPASAGASSSADWNLFYQARVSGYFTSVAAISSTDAWAVGNLLKGQTVVYEPLVRHWNGSSWRAVSISGASGVKSDLVAASSVRNVWVMGEARSGYSRAFRYDGTRWHTVPVPAQTQLADPLVLAPNDVWAIGYSATTSSDIFHWNGTRWVGYHLNAQLSGLSGTRANDVWAVATTPGDKLEAYSWNGFRWRFVTMPHPVSNQGESIHVSSASNIWIAGQANSAPTYALHWSGRTWHKMTTPSSLGASPSLVSDGSGGLWFGPFVHWTGRAWVGPIAVSNSYASAGFSQMAHVPGTSSDWMVGVTQNIGSTIGEPSIYLYGPVP